MKKIHTILFTVMILTACSDTDQNLNELVEAASSVTSETLQLEGIGSVAVMINPADSNPRIEIILQDEKELTSVEIEEVQKRIQDAVYSNTNVSFNVLIRSKSEEELRDEKWHPIFKAIYEKTEEEFEEYRGFAYSFSPEPLQIIIKTHLQDNKSTSNLEKIEQIEEYVDEIIKQKIKELYVEELPYKIIVRSKDNEDLN
ncbi:hypothetical protein MHB48_09605 [Psychrobacillus sp. FSL H8-0483]|uniref:hypothetical protein n=1 Tax=Psychrobacillus sp. FSL H8-0483 TaxID=2921389 RepID=UPI00315A443F